jgi:hypothetical protein
MMFGGDYMIDQSVVANLVDHATYLSAAKQRLEGPDPSQLHESVRAALAKAVHPFGG